MACNGCYSSFSLLRPEKGCPSCGYSYCSKCLGNKIYLPRSDAEHKVCNKCKNASTSMNKSKIMPPDAFYKRMLGATVDGPNNATSNPKDDQMLERLNKIKDKCIGDAKTEKKQATDAEIAERLQKVKGDVPITSDAELHARLAKLRGIPVIENKAPLMTKDLRTEQEQVEDLMKQYLENTAIDCKYKEEFDSVINIMEGRLQKLKGANPQPEATGSQTVPESSAAQVESEDEEESVKKIIEKLRKESLLEEAQVAPPTNDELPFCEICNEDADMRCLGCRYLFCKRCFRDHKDDDDGCNTYELYTAPKNE